MLLLVETSGEWNEINARLFHAGILFYRATEENALFLAEKKDIGGAVVDCRAGNRAEGIVRELRACYPEMPIAALLSPDAVPKLPVERVIRDADAETVAGEISDFFLRVCGWSPCTLSTPSLAVPSDPKGRIIYMGLELKLPPRAHRLLYCLFYLAPRTADADDLTCFVGGEPALTRDNLSVLVHEINRRAAVIDGCRLVNPVRGKGYRLRGGIV